MLDEDDNKHAIPVVKWDVEEARISGRVPRILFDGSSAQVNQSIRDSAPPRKSLRGLLHRNSSYSAPSLLTA